MSSVVVPAINSRVKVVKSFYELVTTPFRDGINALCWERTLVGDFAEVARLLSVGGGITTLDEITLRNLPVGPAGKMAIEVLIEDQRLLQAHGLAPILDAITAYPRDDEDGPVRTDVFSFHADSATTEAGTYLCTYHGATSEGLLNEEARRRVDIPETRAELLQCFGGEDTPDFLEYLHENCYDLHYAPLPGARPYSFGTGNLWRIAIEYPGAPVPPCIHRAPETLPDQPPRLLLIS